MKYLSLILFVITSQVVAVECEPPIAGNAVWYKPKNISIEQTPVEQFNGGGDCAGEDFIIQYPPRGGYAHQDFDDFSYVVPNLIQNNLYTSVSIDFKSLFDGADMGSIINVFEFDVFDDTNDQLLNLRIRLKKKPLLNSNRFKWKVHVLWYDTQLKANGQQHNHTDDYFWVSDEVDSGVLTLNIKKLGAFAEQTTVQAVSNLQDINGALVLLDQSTDANNPIVNKFRQIIDYASPFSAMDDLLPAEQRIGIISSNKELPHGAGMVIYRY